MKILARIDTDQEGIDEEEAKEVTDVVEEDSSNLDGVLEGMKRRPRKRMKTAKEELTNVVSYENMNQSNSLTLGENMDIIIIHVYFHHGVKKRDRSGREKRVLEVPHLVVKYLHWKSNLVGDIWCQVLEYNYLPILAKPT